MTISRDTDKVAWLHEMRGEGKTLNDKILDWMQAQTEGILLSMIHQNRINASFMTDDALWLVDSFILHLKEKEAADYLTRRAMEMPADEPVFRYVHSEYMGQDCVSVIGDITYHSLSVGVALVHLSFQTSWVKAEAGWKVKQMVTSVSREQNSDTEGTGDRLNDERKLIEALPLGMVCCSREERLPVRMVNQKALEMLGYASAEEYTRYMGDSLYPAIHPDDMLQLRTYVKSLESESTQEGVCVRIRRKDFTYRWYQFFGSIWEQWLILACTDYTDNQNYIDNIHKQREELSEIQDSYRMLIDYLPSGFHRCSLTDPVKLDYVSDNFCAMTRYTRSDIREKIDSVYEEMIVPEDRQLFAETARAMMQYPHTEQFTYHLQRKDGRIVRVLDKMRSVRHADGTMWGYSIILELDERPGSQPKAEETRQTGVNRTDTDHVVEIHTFGYFEVLVDGKPIAFRFGKARELFALLVDRKGNFISRESIITMLWENEPVNPTTQARCRKTYMNLVTELRNYGIEDIVETENGQRRIIPQKVNCDLFDYQAHKPNALTKFKGEYMNEYSWSEQTLSTLLSG